MSGAGNYITVPEFRPTMNEFSNFENYVRTCVFPRASHAGIAKVIAPPEWRPTQSGSYPDDLDFVIETPITQHISGAKGIYQHMSEEQNPVQFKHFRSIALQRPQNQQQSSTTPHAPDSSAPAPAAAVLSGDFELAPELSESEKQNPFDAWESRFWRNIRFRPPMYGADMPGSLFEDESPDKPNPWNLAHLRSLLTEKLNRPLPGVTTSYLYVGMWKSCFAWHTEDMDLAAINYLHFGAPKAWYGVPVAQRTRFEEVARLLFPEHFQSCPEFLRHKQTMIAPSILKKHGITLCRVLQEPRQFIITLPGAYHSGFNTGFNVAEATNFATAEWIPLGLRAKFCQCRQDSVRIDMSLFVDPSPSNATPDGNTNEKQDESEHLQSTTVDKTQPAIPITIRASVKPPLPLPSSTPEETAESKQSTIAPNRPRITVSAPNATSKSTVLSEPEAAADDDEALEEMVSEFTSGEKDGDFLYYSAADNETKSARKRTRGRHHNDDEDSDSDSDYQQPGEARDDPDFVQGRRKHKRGAERKSSHKKQHSKKRKTSPAKPGNDSPSSASPPPNEKSAKQVLDQEERSASPRKIPGVQQIVVPTKVFLSPTSSVLVEKRINVPILSLSHKKKSPSSDAHRHPLFKKRFGSK